MLDFNTMRYGTDIFVLREPPKICSRINNANVSVTLVDTQPTPPCIALHTGGANWYAKLTTGGTSAMGVRINSTNYTLTS